LGEHWDRISDYLRPVAIPLAISLLLLGAYHFYRRFREVAQPETAPMVQDDPEG